MKLQVGCVVLAALLCCSMAMAWDKEPDPLPSCAITWHDKEPPPLPPFTPLPPVAKVVPPTSVFDELVAVLAGLGAGSLGLYLFTFWMLFTRGK